MGEPQTVPMFAPDGTLGDIPYERMMDAMKAGAKPAVTMKAPDGSTGLIPADRMQDAVKAGGTIVPLKDQEAQHAGFWHTLYSDLSGMAPGLGTMARAAATQNPAELTQGTVEQGKSIGQNYQERKAAGNSLPYRLGAAANEALGVNVKGEEEAAKSGDVGGVLGHAAAVPAVIAATEGAAKGAPAAANAIRETLPSVERAGEAFQAVSKVAGKHTVAVTPELSNALVGYQQLVDAGGSRSLAVNKLLNRLTDPAKGPLTYDEARLFQSNISRLSADEAQRLTPVMKRQVGQIAAELNGAVEDTAANAGQLNKFRSAMSEYAAAKTNEARMEVLKRYGLKAGLALAGGGLAATGGKLAYDVLRQ